MKRTKEQMEVIAKAAVILAKNKKECSGFPLVDGDSPGKRLAIKEYLAKRKVDLSAFDNVIEGTYEECQNAFDKAVGLLENREWKTYGGDTIGEWAIFSMYDTSDDDIEDGVKYPDFENNPLICEGELKVKIQDWNSAEITLTDPRINDVFKFFANNHDGHHGFIEGVDMEGDTLIIYSGS